MFLRPSESIDETIVRILSEQPRKASWIHKTIGTEKVSLQGLYKALRRLSAESVILKHGQLYVTNSEWIDSVQDAFGASAISLKPGDKARYEFSDFNQVDAYWRHIVRNIPSEHTQVSPFFYLPHDIWVYLPDRSKNIKVYYDSFAANKQSAYLLIGDNTAEDKSIKKALRDDYLQVNTIAMPGLKRNQHIAIFGDYITITTIPLRVAEQIDELYDGYKGDELTERINHIFAQKTSIRIVLTYDPDLSAQLRKKIGKDFVMK